MRFRPWRSLLVVSCCTLGVGAPATPAAASPHAALATTRPAEVRRLDPEIVRPEPGSARARALAARNEWRWVRVRALAERALPEAAPAEAARLRWLAAVGARNVQDERGAEALLAPVAEGDSPLARHAKLRLAGWIAARDPELALALLDGVLVELDGQPPWPLTRTTQRLRAGVLAQLGRADEAIATLRALADATPDRHVLNDLAELLDARGTPDDLLEALALWREVAHRFPTYRDGRAAEEAAQALLAKLDGPARAAAGEPSLSLRLTRAWALLDAWRFLDARDAFAALFDETASSSTLHCEVRFGHAKALVKARRRSEGAPLMARVADECSEDPNQRAWARYYAGRAYAALGENDLAVEQYAALEREAPEHRLADDALWRAAKVARESGDEATARQRLEALPERYPEGDMGARARFGLAWQARSEGELQEALAHLDRLLELEDREPTEDMHGRAAYWRARVLSELGRDRSAVAGYAALVKRWPLTYYGQQARARLLDLDPARAEALRAQLSEGAPPALDFEWRHSFATPGFARALELLRVGETGLAQGELRALQLLGEAADTEAAWLSAALLDRAGVHDGAVALVRGQLGLNLLGKLPTGREGHFWRIAYPRAYAPLIDKTARRFDVPAPFVRAVAREESNFNPQAVSPARAYGLIQLILPTAKAVARGLGMQVDPQRLRQPEVNLPVGTRFIAGLAARYRGQYALVPAAYNAGPGAAGRWLDERGDQDLDEWIENIPYDETRHYTRRVLQSYGIYSWLSSGELPRLPLRLPAL